MRKIAGLLAGSAFDRPTRALAILPAVAYSPGFFWFALVFSVVFAAIYVATDMNLFFDGSIFHPQ